MIWQFPGRVMEGLKLMSGMAMGFSTAALGIVDHGTKQDTQRYGIIRHMKQILFLIGTDLVVWKAPQVGVRRVKAVIGKLA